MKKKLNYYLILSILLFLISLSQKTYCVDIECGDSWNGLFSLCLGVIGVFLGGAFLTWLANPFLIISWIIIRSSPISALICSGIASFICLSFLFFDKIMVNEAGYYKEITSYGLGYYLWTTSSISIFLGNLINYLKKRKVESIIK